MSSEFPEDLGTTDSLGTDGYNKQLELTKLSNAPRNLRNIKVLR